MMMMMMMMMMEEWCFDQTGTNLSSEYDEHDVENDDGALLTRLAADAGNDANCW